MSDTVNLAVEKAIVAVLNSDGAPVEFDRAYPGDYSRAQLPAANLVPMGFKRDTGETSHDSEGITAAWAVLLHAVASDATAPGTDAIDAMLAWAWAQLYKDVTLGGIVRELSISQGAYHYDHGGDCEQVHLQLDITAEFDVRRGDLTANYNTEG